MKNDDKHQNFDVDGIIEQSKHVFLMVRPLPYRRNHLKLENTSVLMRKIDY
jgi:hypothetical protein